MFEHHPQTGQFAQQRLARDGANELTAELWIAPELRFLPVRIRIEQDASTYVDLMIAKKPEIAAISVPATVASARTTP